jgi:hypothetical protein
MRRILLLAVVVLAGCGETKYINLTNGVCSVDMKPNAVKAIPDARISQWEARYELSKKDFAKEIESIKKGPTIDIFYDDIHWLNTHYPPGEEQLARVTRVTRVTGLVGCQTAELAEIYAVKRHFGKEPLDDIASCEKYGNTQGDEGQESK